MGLRLFKRHAWWRQPGTAFADPGLRTAGRPLRHRRRAGARGRCPCPAEAAARGRRQAGLTAERIPVSLLLMQEMDLMLRPMGPQSAQGAVGAGVAAPVTAAPVRARIEEGAKC